MDYVNKLTGEIVDWIDLGDTKRFKPMVNSTLYRPGTIQLVSRPGCSWFITIREQWERGNVIAFRYYPVDPFGRPR